MCIYQGSALKISAVTEGETKSHQDTFLPGRSIPVFSTFKKGGKRPPISVDCSKILGKTLEQIIELSEHLEKKALFGYPVSKIISNQPVHS